MPLSEERIHEALRRVVDPELGINIVDLGMIYEVRIDRGGEKPEVHVRMTMTTPACPYGPELVRQVKEAVETLDAVNRAEVEVTLSPPWTPDRMTEDARDELGFF